MKTQDIIDNLTQTQDTIEGRLLQRKLMRELYKSLGTPTKEDFPSEFNHSCYWDKSRGYTTRVPRFTESEMRHANNEETDWHIKRASATKHRIVEDYTRDGWHATVYAMNVICTKYVKHPRYKNLWVLFYRSRDCSNFEYVIEEN